MSQVHLGISTCPNDTYAFHGLFSGAVRTPGLEFSIELMDVEELNLRLFAGDFDVAKCSFHAALALADQVGVLSVGSALGFGVGPLLLGARPGFSPGGRRPDGSPAIVLCPGAHTTATLLYRLFHPGEGTIEQVVFSDIMPRLRAGSADFGVCIHEGRFTWREQGLVRVEDLGETWETRTKTPLPLGGIVARHSLGAERQRAVAAAIKASIDYARAHLEEVMPTMRRYAQEMSDEVLMAHVELYVNQWTLDLGPAGQQALARLSREAAAVGLIPPGVELAVVGS